MRDRVRILLDHPLVRTLLFERLLITASAALALAALATGHVRASEIPGLLDLRLLALFFVLTVAVELGKDSDLFDRLVAAIVRRARHARAPAYALMAVTALCAALLTNDDFSLVLVFALLFVGVEGLERGRLYHALDPERFFGHGPTGLLVSGALLSQLVSNVPAAMLLAPAAHGAASFTGLLYGVNAGGCGTPVSSLANLIGAELHRCGGGRPGHFWRLFLAVSGALLVAMFLYCLAILRLGTR
jgi:Na+/H+ antiporter NhaD/arsenite permease-like protein